MALKNKELAATYEKEMKRVYDQIDKFPWDDKASYGAWLTQSYHMTKYTTRVAALTAGNFTIGEDDMHQKGLSHLREELGHEKFALNDLKRLGLSEKDYPEFMQCRLMIQSQYYFIGRHPSAHFGFVLPLETIACFRGDEIVKAVRKAYGTGPEQFIHVHAEVDKGHVEEMFKLINMSPDWVAPHIQANLEQTGVLYSEMLERAAHWGKNKGKKAA